MLDVSLLLVGVVPEERENDFADFWIESVFDRDGRRVLFPDSARLHH